MKLVPTTAARTAGARPFRLALLLLAALLAPAPWAAAVTEKAIFGAGCFWCVEAIYERTPGVIEAVSGYAGGPEKNPTYDEVSAGRTGHAEVVQVTFDPAIVSYEKLLELFWKTHDPTDPRGVAPDFGRQYRSMILYHDDAQRQAIERSRSEAQKRFSKPIATQVVPLEKFHPAEEYHQDYVRRNPNDGYVRAVAIPKLRKLGLEEKEVKGGRRPTGAALLPAAAVVAVAAVALLWRAGRAAG